MLRIQYQVDFGIRYRAFGGLITTPLAFGPIRSFGLGYLTYREVGRAGEMVNQSVSGLAPRLDSCERAASRRDSSRPLPIPSPTIALGSERFKAQIAAMLERSVEPGAPGRPRKENSELSEPQTRAGRFHRPEMVVSRFRRRAGAPFFFGDFLLWASKKKVTGTGAAPRYPRRSRFRGMRDEG